MKQSTLIALFALIIGLFCMSFLPESKIAEEKTIAPIDEVSLIANNSDSLKQIAEATETHVDNELAKINAELLSLEKEVEIVHQNTTASYYHDKFNGRKTASGALFSNKEMTAAHKTLPFGTKLRVTNLKNNQTVIVTITDRGPYIKGRSLDLSKAAFMKIANNKGSGHMEVKIEKLPKNYLAEFDELIELKSALVAKDTKSIHQL